MAAPPDVTERSVGVNCSNMCKKAAPVLAVNTPVNTLSHTVNLTARVSESQKGQRKLMARTSEGFSETHGCFRKSRLEVTSGSK